MADKEMTATDAPVHYSSEEAFAWAAGWNTAATELQTKLDDFKARAKEYRENWVAEEAKRIRTEAKLEQAERERDHFEARLTELPSLKVWTHTTQQRDLLLSERQQLESALAAAKQDVLRWTENAADYACKLAAAQGALREAEARAEAWRQAAGDMLEQEMERTDRERVRAWFKASEALTRDAAASGRHLHPTAEEFAIRIGTHRAALAAESGKPGYDAARAALRQLRACFTRNVCPLGKGPTAHGVTTGTVESMDDITIVSWEADWPAFLRVIGKVDAALAAELSGKGEQPELASRDETK